MRFLGAAHGQLVPVNDAGFVVLDAAQDDDDFFFWFITILLLLSMLTGCSTPPLKWVGHIEPECKSYGNFAALCKVADRTCFQSRFGGVSCWEIP